MRYSLETRALVLRRIFEQAPHHAKKLRQLGRSNCTGFCKLLEFNSRASEEVKDLIFRMMFASMGSQLVGGARSRGVGVVNDTS